MEMLNNIWMALTTENEVLTKIISFPFIFIEAVVTMLLFTEILNIKSTKRQNFTYVIFISLLGAICSYIIPKPYSNIIPIIVLPLAVMVIFKVNLLQGLLAELLPVICITISEIIITRLFLILFQINYEMCASIPFYRLLSTLLIYFLIFILYKLIRYFKFNIKNLEFLTKKNKKIIIINILFALIVIFMQMYLIGYYNDKLPLYIIIMNVLSLISYFFFSIYSMIKTMNLEKTQTDLEQEKLYNKALQILHDNIKTFKHDFSNILSGIGGYVETNDMAGLKKYYYQLLEDCNQVNNLTSLNPDVINNPAVYTVLANKYYKADNLGITISLDSFINFDNLHMEIYEFTRILGILMDNAIEASSECDNKIVNVIIREDKKQNRQLLVIENTYKNKDIDINKIYDKGFSTKEKNTGLGLWEVDKIIRKHKNLTRFTTKNNEFFKQQIEIYNE